MSVIPAIIQLYIQVKTNILYIIVYSLVSRLTILQNLKPRLMAVESNGFNEVLCYDISERNGHKNSFSGVFMYTHECMIEIFSVLVILDSVN